MINIITHNGKFHADEVSAVALLKVFLDNDVKVTRVSHNAELSTYTNKTFILDIGRVHNPSNLRFDHHQWRAGEGEMNLSSVGLIFKWLLDNNHINAEIHTSLSILITMIDENDIGIRQATTGEIPWVINKFNNKDIYSSEQDDQFLKAVELMCEIFSKVKEDVESYQYTVKYLNDLANKVAPETKILLTMEYLTGWEKALRDNPLLDNIDVLVRYDKATDNWQAQTVAKEAGSFEKRGRSIRCLDNLPDGMEFVHKGEFLAVAKSLDVLEKYLEENLYIKN